MRIRDGKLLYHLTTLSVFESIVKNGLLSRGSLLQKKLPFVDTANHDILEGRERLDLVIIFLFIFTYILTMIPILKIIIVIKSLYIYVYTETMPKQIISLFFLFTQHQMNNPKYIHHITKE